MKLARSAVFAVGTQGNKSTAFLYINSKGEISPFWRSEYHADGWSKHGELDLICGQKPINHDHWYGIELDGVERDITMIQSHVTRAEGVDFKRALKFIGKH
ncbi:hypothetical protein HOT14_gp08 [Escherichia phage vB_EcoS_IME347]|uniref:Uncharacterized protein n=1 Tax=Escherichia phage vB_EcoS_IME347 TaxID=2496546 RepID=A0A2S1GS33_9CAUD|nr:hypothetical protein HOT14_gp08 [Escherichia phage vB_EcoS_IME347]AWD92208.1 hypothetical protein [Escherichia phage vB_EcoS_IME347]